MTVIEKASKMPGMSKCDEAMSRKCNFKADRNDLSAQEQNCINDQFSHHFSAQ